MRKAIPIGLTGIVKWDEDGDEVIVEFDRDVPGDGFGLLDRQAWVPRSSIGIEP